MTGERDGNSTQHDKCVPVGRQRSQKPIERKMEHLRFPELHSERGSHQPFGARQRNTQLNGRMPGRG